MTILMMPHPPLAVVPILIGPLQVLMAILPAILVAIGGVIISMLKPSSIKIGLQVLWNNKFSTLVTVAVIAGSIYGFSFIPGCHNGQAAAYQGKAEWTMFRGGLERRGGGVDGMPDPVAGSTIWSFAQNFKTVYSSPAVVGNRVIASAAKKEVFADRGSIYCLDALNGAKVWEFAPSDFRATFSSPSVSGDYVVCGEGLHETHDARIFCLSFKDGKKLWEVRASSHVESSPCFYSNMVFCGAGADGVYGFALNPPAGTSPVVWHIKGLNEKAAFHCDASLAAADGRVYLSSAALHDDDWNGIACVDAATGKEIWHVDTPVPVWGSATIVSNRLIVGMGNGNFVESAEQYWARKQDELRKAGKSPAEIAALAPKYAAGGELWAIDLTTHKVLWTRKHRLTLLGAVASADGNLFYSAMDGLFTCITLDNELVAQWDAHEGIKTSPAIGKDHVYVITDSGRFFGLDRRTLRPVWQTRVGNGDLFTSSPAIGNGHVYIGTPENGLVCMGNAIEPDLLWPGARAGAGKSGCADGSSLPAKGAFAWRWPADAAEDAHVVPPVIEPSAVLNGTLYATVNGSGQTGLLAFAVGTSSSEGGAAAKMPETNKWFFATTLPPGAAVAATTSRVYIAEGRMGEAGRKLHCVDAVSGREMWQSPIEAGASGEFTLTTSNLFLCCRSGELSCLVTRGAEAGRTCWTAPVGHIIGLPCVAGDLVLAATAENGVVAVDVMSGKISWKHLASSALVSGAVANEDVVAIAMADHLAGLSMANGAVLWTVPCAPSTAPLVVDDERVFCTQTNGEIAAVTWDGSVAFRVKGAQPAHAAMLFGDKLLFCNQKGELQKVELAEKHQESRWLATAWLGTITTPPLLADGVVYFATAEKGLICARQGKR